MLKACFLETLAEMFEAPKLRFIVHSRKVEFLKQLLFLLHMTADITGISKHLCQEGMHLYPHIPPSKYLITSLERPEVRWDQNDIDLLVFESFPCSLALLLALFWDGAIDELFGVWHLFVEVVEEDDFVPAEIDAVLSIVVQEALVEFGLGVADEDEIGNWLGEHQNILYYYIIKQENFEGVRYGQ